MRFRYIPAGGFEMGSPDSEEERDDDELQHHVTLTRGFWMGETEVTQGQWVALMAENPSRFKACGESCPVERVSWFDVVAYANNASGEADLARCYEINGERVTILGPRCQGYRLPTEAEWEYATRAGSSTPFWTGQTLETDQANYDGSYPYAGGRKGDYREATVPVRSFDPNPWGLFDVHGNVWEWCSDWFESYESGSQVDPPGPDAGSDRVLRGGSWYCSAGSCRSAFRSYSLPDNPDIDVGFRLVRTAE